MLSPSGEKLNLVVEKREVRKRNSGEDRKEKGHLRCTEQFGVFGKVNPAQQE